MSRWTVTMEFVPIDGAEPRTDDDDVKVASGLRERLIEYGGAAHGNSTRFVISTEVEAATSAEAETWARSEVYDAVKDALPDWRLDRLDSWSA